MSKVSRVSSKEFQYEESLSDFFFNEQMGILKSLGQAAHGELKIPLEALIKMIPTAQLGQANSFTKRIQSLIEVFLRLQKLGAYENNIHAELLPIWNDTLSYFNGDLVRLNLNTQCFVSEGFKVPASPALLQWLLLNIFRAIVQLFEHTNGGTITLESDGLKSFTISESGIGFAPEQLKTMTHLRGELKLIFRILNEMKVDWDIISQKGQGTSFVINF